MWDQVAHHFLIDGLSAFSIISLELLEDSVVNPQIDIALPMLLLWDRWNVLDGSFVNLPCPVHAAALLL